MRELSQLAIVLILTGCSVMSTAQAAGDVESRKHKAWDMLQTAISDKRSGERADGVRALGLLRDNTRARQLAEDSLQDRTPQVRAAAATALGQMHSTASIPKLKAALADHKIPVVMAAAQSLRELKDDSAAYEIYYDLLTGEKKSGDGLIAQQIDTLKNPKELAKIGFAEGIGFVPFAGIGWDAWRAIHRKDPNPVRAVAATYLAHDPDPDTAKALVKATRDKNWVVRAAAIQALAQRNDPSLLAKVQHSMSDRNSKVRYSAAAAVVRLSPPEKHNDAANSGQ